MPTAGCRWLMRLEMGKIVDNQVLNSMKNLLILTLFAAAAVSASAADKRIIFIAGNPSHGPGEHEHRAGCLLLKKCLDQNPGFTSEVYSNGWPQDEKVFE